MTYRRVGQHPGAALLMSILPQLELVDRPGYLVSKNEPTIEAVQPLLAGVFPRRWLVARFVSVKPEGIVPLHTDEPAPMAWRLLVVQTNPDAWALHDGTWQHLEQDGIYEAEPHKAHAAVNYGKQPRVHLVIGTAA